MILALLLFVSLYPVIGIWFYVRYSRLHMKAPVFLVALICGVASAVIAALLQGFISTLPFDSGRFSAAGLQMFESFVWIAFPEEMARFIMLLLFFFLAPKIFKIELHSGMAIACGLTAGLMFASLETAHIGASNAPFTIIRLFTAAPLHAACGARCAMAAFNPKENPRTIRHLLGAIILHGFYDTMLPRGGIFAGLAILFALLALIRALQNCLAEEV